MSQRLYRLRHLASTKHRLGLLPISAATIWRMVRAGKFPKPFKLAAHVTVWDAREIDDFVAQQRAESATHA